MFKFQALATHNTELLKEDLKLLLDDLDLETLVWSEGDVLDRILKIVEIFQCITIERPQLQLVVEKFSSELQFEPEPSRTELQVQFKVWKFS